MHQSHETNKSNQSKKDKQIMPINLRITPEDMKRGVLVDPAWYQCKITDVSEEEASTDGTQNVICELTIQSGKFQGVTVRRYFNAKGAGFAVPFLQALGAQIDPSKPLDVDFEGTKGKLLDVYIGRREAKDGSGKKYNDPSDFRPAGQAVKTP